MRREDWIKFGTVSPQENMLKPYLIENGVSGRSPIRQSLVEGNKSLNILVGDTPTKRGG